MFILQINIVTFKPLNGFLDISCWIGSRIIFLSADTKFYLGAVVYFAWPPPPTPESFLSLVVLHHIYCDCEGVLNFLEHPQMTVSGEVMWFWERIANVNLYVWTCCVSFFGSPMKFQGCLSPPGTFSTVWDAVGYLSPLVQILHWFWQPSVQVSNTLFDALSISTQSCVGNWIKLRVDRVWKATELYLENWRLHQNLL